MDENGVKGYYNEETNEIDWEDENVTVKLTLITHNEQTEELEEKIITHTMGLSEARAERIYGNTEIVLIACENSKELEKLKGRKFTLQKESEIVIINISANKATRIINN